jgi:hypothetical protein
LRTGPFIIFPSDLFLFQFFENRNLGLFLREPRATETKQNRTKKQNKNKKQKNKNERNQTPKKKKEKKKKETEKKEKNGPLRSRAGFEQRDGREVHGERYTARAGETARPRLEQLRRVRVAF